MKFYKMLVFKNVIYSKIYFGAKPLFIMLAVINQIRCKDLKAMLFERKKNGENNSP